MNNRNKINVYWFESMLFEILTGRAVISRQVSCRSIVLPIVDIRKRVYILSGPSIMIKLSIDVKSALV
jgi:hypothetical protein